MCLQSSEVYQIFNNFVDYAGVSLLKVGGRMVYSTCSMNPVENEAVVAEVNVSIVFYTYESSKEGSVGLLHLLKDFCAQRLPYISSNICTLLPAYRKL